MIAYLYAALTLRAAGRPVDGEGLCALLEAAGLPPREDWVRGIIRLVSPAGEPPADGGATPARGAPAPAAVPATATCYLYCVVPGAQGASLGPIGVGGRDVCLVSGETLSAVVHACDPASPLGAATPLEGVLAHQRVIEVATERFGNALPLPFGQMVGSGEGAGELAEDAIRRWLREDGPSLVARLERVRGRQEYGVQVLWDPAAVAGGLHQEEPGLAGLPQAVGGTGPGRAYLARELRQADVERRALELAGRYVQACHEAVSRRVETVRVEKIREAEGGLRMLLHLSCLLTKDEAPGLAEALAAIPAREGLSVRLTGPWPPYSFVS